MGQDLSSAVSRLRTPAVSLAKAQARSGNPTLVNARYHPHGSGRLLSDDYVLENKTVLGRGASGDSVVLAYDKARRTKFAVKSLDLRRAARDVLWQRAAEVEICLAVDHPYIARLFDVYENGYGMLHMVLECCSGGELFYRLVSKGNFDEREAATALAQMLRAVGYLHARGIVHRDLKPENFLFESEDPASPLKLIDFGFGQLWDHSTPMTTCCGSLNYVSPEVLLQQGYTDKCDLWSLGVVAFMLLVGKPPFQGPEREVKQKIKAGLWPQQQRFSPEASDFVRSLLQKEPERRLTAQKALFHPWLIREAVTQTGQVELGPAVLPSLRAYAAAPPVQRAVLQLVAQQLAAGSELRTLFLALDMENLGAVQVPDLIGAIERACQRTGRPPEPELCSALQSIWGRSVGYTEFIAAAAGLQGEGRAVAAAFGRMDVRKAGRVGVSDLQRVFGKAFDAAAIKSWLRHTSQDGSELTLASLVGTLGAGEAAPFETSS